MVIKILFSELRQKNAEFMSLLVQALQLNNNVWSIIPSLLFLVFSMSFIHRITHKNAPRFRRNTYKDAVYREIAFQWLYLYVTRGWLYVVKGLRLASAYLEDTIYRAGGSSSDTLYVHIAMFLIFVFIGLLPLLLTITVFGSEEFIEDNIIFWIPPNRWTRTELGTAGRLMERPPDIIFTSSRYPHAYETKRSVSSEISKNTSNVEVIRYCRSGFLPEQVSSIEEMIHVE